MEMTCSALALTQMEKSVEQRKYKNDDRDADDVVSGGRLRWNRRFTALLNLGAPDHQGQDKYAMRRFSSCYTE
jgi:hypothetical protein